MYYSIIRLVREGLQWAKRKEEETVEFLLEKKSGAHYSLVKKESRWSGRRKEGRIHRWRKISPVPYGFNRMGQRWPLILMD